MADNVKVAISTDFLTSFAKLPRQIQGKVTEFVNKFRNDPTSPGINYEKIANAQDKKICSVRIDNTYRGIVVRQPETGVYLLLRGRSSILKINYRTTEEIRKYAFALLNGISFDDLDEDIDIGDKCQSLTHGAAPIIKNFKDANEELSFISEEIKKLKDNGVALNDICVVARTKSLLDDYVRQLKGEGINTFVIKRNKNDDRGLMGVRVATMHRVKGLEFKYVFVVAVNNRIVPLPAAINHTDTISEAESITSEKCLLYVALTRAQKGAYITSYGKKSDFLK